MAYSDLYEHCQTLSPRIKRNAIRDKVLALTGVERITHVRTTLDVAKTRGFYLSASNRDHRLVQQCGTHVVVTARGLEQNEERFIYIKELMHLFDRVDAATDSGDKFEVQLNEFAPTKDRSPQGVAEIVCFYRALSCICPETHRKDYQSKREDGRIDDYAISLEVGLPLYYVPRLFSGGYTDIVTWLCNGNGAKA
jgi:hypothetical protein